MRGLVIKRGEIWWAELPRPRGSGPGWRRPVLVVQADAFNRSRISTVMAAAITSILRMADAPGNVRLTRRQSGLPRASVVNVSQVVTLDRSLLTGRVAALPAESLRAVDAGLRLALSL